MTQTALLLSRQEGGTLDHWSGQLRAILSGAMVPTMDMLTCIDQIIAKPTKAHTCEAVQGALF